MEKNISKAIKSFGFLYFLINCVFLTILLIFIIYFLIKLNKTPGVVMTFFPIIGVLSGYWIRTGKYGWWRSVIIALSFLCSVVILLIAFVSGPKMEKTKMEKFVQKRTIHLDENTQRMFIGVYSQDISIVKEQLDKGVDVNAKNEFGQTALHITQNKEIVQLLIAKGADVNARDYEYNMTPIFNKDVGLAKILVEAGADIHVKSEKGNTPLMWYCYSGHIEGIKYLVSLGAYINVKNEDGQTAYNIAEHFGHFELLKYLKLIGAKPGKEIK